MKLLYIATGYTPVLPSSSRSVETSIHFLTKEQAKLGHDVTVVDIKTSRPRGNTKVKFYELRSTPFKASNIFSYFLKIITFTLQLPRVLYRNKNADIIQAYSQFPGAVAIISKKLFKLKVQVFYLTCSPYLAMPPSLLNRLKHTLIEGWVLRKADKVLVHTKVGTKNLVQRFRVNPLKVVQIYAGVDLEEIDGHIKTHRFFPRNPQLIFYPAVITPRKNQLTLVKTIPEVLKTYPDCEVILAGPIEDKNYYNEIQKFITGRGLSNIDFTGHLTKPEVYMLYQKATIMVFPTLSEMQGIVLMEAMAFGVPIIASNIGVIEEITRLKTGCAILVDPNNSEGIGEAIIKVLSHKDLRDQLSKQGKKLAYSRFGWNRIAKEMEAVYGQSCREAPK